MVMLPRLGSWPCPSKRHIETEALGLAMAGIGDRLDRADIIA
jgi:hypothetical protein